MKRKYYYMALVILFFFLFNVNLCFADEKKIDFDKDQVIKIPNMPEIVNSGKVVFTKGDKPGTVTAKITGAYIKYYKKDNTWKSCLACVEEIELAPNLSVPMLFFSDIEASSQINEFDKKMPPGGQQFLAMQVKEGKQTLDLSPEDLKSGEISAIVSGIKGAKLRKVEGGFKLIAGEAFVVLRKKHQLD